MTNIIEAIYVAKKTKKRAFSYIRFSTQRQLEGDSLSRQVSGTEKYCEENNLELDPRSYRDLGVSGFRGANQRGQLGDFIAACEQGLIPEGAALVIESLDRLSREKPRKIISLLTRILDFGIEVHLSMIRKVFKPDSEDDGTDLIMAVALAMRAHEESKTKSKRVLEAFAKKRQAAEESGARFVGSLPEWVRVEGDKMEIIPEKAAAVKQVYTLVASGFSSRQAARKVLEETGIKWTSKRVRELLHSKNVQGILSAHYRTAKAGRSYTISDYYPRIVSDELAAEARAVLERHAAPSRGRSAVVHPTNILRGLLRYQGAPMRCVHRRNGAKGEDGKKAYIAYFEAFDETRDKIIHSIHANQLEPVLIQSLRELQPSDLAPVAAKESPMASIRARLAKLEATAGNLLRAVESGSVAVARRLAEVEAEIVTVRDALGKAEAEEKIALPGKQDLEELKIDLVDPQQRERAGAALRRIVERIDLFSSLKDMPAIGRRVGKMIYFRDPTPKVGNRKPIFALLHFIGGAQRLVLRDDARMGFVASIRFEAVA